jgi:hypothetical protein
VFAGEAFITSIWLRSISLAVLGILSLALGYGFYRVSLPIARLRSVYLQSCFDLFRMDLLKQMRISLPETLVSEFDTWVTVRGLLLADVDPASVRYATPVYDEQN